MALEHPGTASDTARASGRGRLLAKTKEHPMSIHARVLTSLSVGVAMLIIGTVVTLTANDSRAAFQGVWRTVEVVVATPTPQVFRPDATLAIFHGSHYSRVEVHAE